MIQNASRRRSLLICLAAYGAALAAAAAGGLAASLLFASASGPRPLVVALAADLAATVAVFAFSLAFDNSSLYDPYWSVTPPLLALYWLGEYGGGLTPRRALALALLGVWALRLTANWVRRWRGLADEDFRYADMRRRFGRGYWPVAFAAIHLFPTLIVFLGCLPLHELLRAPSPPPARALRLLDAAALLVTAGAVAIEAAADRQLSRFRRSGAPPGAILAEGLWALCRHPNYLGEISFWWGLYLFCLAASPGSWWAVVGPLSMTALFVAVSVPMMDRHLSRGRPGYAEHRRQLPALLPSPARLLRLPRRPRRSHGSGR